ncbi:TetR/AcrR family transcriptional regulator [Antrihabitans cavernicola]|uniref:TetR/AcrR family transcriptional regulator n=1 Tax=Antrihabitans cavernicola TaxID=2495913 RepID=A0A5A7SAV2_9NOCA|nr:TetR/AcrR family transcriptional regulator [Spelaeibacter cavernicola]KAA0022292.1 TetR/AcrR family transcriptional regulator [Spelaeibacter cavernicola]
MQNETAGRPRSESTRRAILDAAYDMLAETGFRGLTMEAIAQRAGAGKTTLYRWWPSKAAILLDAVHDRADRYPGFGDSGDVHTDLLDEVRGVIAFYRTKTGAAMLDLIAESRFEPSLAEAISERFIAGRRAATTEVLQRGIERGQVRADLDIDVTMDAIWGSIYYKLLISHATLTSAHADAILALIWPSLRTP